MVIRSDRYGSVHITLDTTAATKTTKRIRRNGTARVYFHYFLPRIQYVREYEYNRNEKPTEFQRTLSFARVTTARRFIYVYFEFSRSYVNIITCIRTSTRRTRRQTDGEKLVRRMRKFPVGRARFSVALGEFFFFFVRRYRTIGKKMARA